MNRFRYVRAGGIAEAIRTVHDDARARFVAGGTNLIDLMKDDVETPSVLVDVNGLGFDRIEAHDESLTIGALARMSDVAEAPAIHSEFPVVAQALLDSASPQLRNMATIGGNLVQRTRCAYFRDATAPCNKRRPGTGCPAIGGINRGHAILGGSSSCICTHASDLAVALTAVNALIHTQGVERLRAIPVREFYLLPEAAPQHETILEPGEIITAVELPRSAAARRSHYLKVRDRASYEFALVSVAAALDVVGGVVRGANLALGGVAPIPWHARNAEALLTGNRLDAERIGAAARVAVAGARGYGLNDFKIELARRSVVRALQTVGTIA
jgi:xanthine dehydrogenase YagS FAD-binding subunit